MTDEELNELESEHGGVPDHLVPPVLEPGNEITLEYWSELFDQVRVAPMGGPYALDISAARQYLSEEGVEDIKWQIKKLRIIFNETYMKKNE